MKFRKGIQKAQDIRLNMTAMIDIVFQLLVFFIMTFKITAMEADFNVRMPLASEQVARPDEVLPTVIRVNLRAGGDRHIAGVDVDNEIQSMTFDQSDMFQRLTEFVERTLAREGDASTAPEVEVEFTIAEALRYKYTVMAMEAVSGKVLPDGTTKRLIEKIKFRSPN
ncbi:MAG TPA: biopolymer transporter ExbD [Pirellulaceae bacterium]|nr:biopolymer transporter ExbD [Pirellulaceae bacterium]